jgi:hypothetical protein
MNRVFGNSTARCFRPLPAAQEPLLSCCPAAMFAGFAGPAMHSAGVMYAVALEAARRQVARERALEIAARTN